MITRIGVGDHLGCDNVAVGVRSSRAVNTPAGTDVGPIDAVIGRALLVGLWAGCGWMAVDAWAEWDQILRRGPFAALVAVTVVVTSWAAFEQYRPKQSWVTTTSVGVLVVVAGTVAIQRRSSDPAVIAVARSTERGIREVLFGSKFSRGERPLADRITDTIETIRDRFGIAPVVSISERLPLIADDAADALGAIGEALTNVAKHAGPCRIFVTVLADQPDGIVALVRDDGIGFNTATVVRSGLQRSVTGRLREVAARCENRSLIGVGTEVEIWIK